MIPHSGRRRSTVYLPPNTLPPPDSRLNTPFLHLINARPRSAVTASASTPPVKNTTAHTTLTWSGNIDQAFSVARQEASSELELLRALVGPEMAMRARIDAAATSVDRAPAVNRTRKRTTDSFDFLCLPREMRDMIYKECMCVDKVFLRPRPFRCLPGHREDVPHVGDRRYKYWYTYTRPETQLLLVCRLVMGEAAPVYFSQNHFVVGTGSRSWPWNYHQYARDYSRDQPRLNVHPVATFCYANIRSLSITLNRRDLQPEDRVFSFEEAISDPIERIRGRPGMTEAERLERIHDDLVYNLGDVWRRRWQNYRDMQLDFFEVSVEYCRCPLKCHRLVTQDWLYLLFTEWKFGPPKRMVIEGLISTKEREQVRQKLNTLAPGVAPNTELRLSRLVKVNGDVEVPLDDFCLTDIEEDEEKDMEGSDDES